MQKPDSTAADHWIYDRLLDAGFDPSLAAAGNLVALLLATLILFIAVAYLSRYFITQSFRRFAKFTTTHFDDLLVNNDFPHYLSLVVPVVIVSRLIPHMLWNFPGWIPATVTLVHIYMILVVMWIVRSVLYSLRDYLKSTEAYRDKPIESYIQVMVIVLYFVAGILLFTRATGQNVLAFLGAMGAASAILMLVFKDTIMGFVASIQVSINDMVRIGDWITMDKYGADGDVIEINLTTVKVQNFDKTITTIPTYTLISDSFKNWRGMHSSGGRRIKRSVYIKISSIRFLSDDDAAHLEKVQLISGYVRERKSEIEAYNENHHIDTDILINGRRMTNVGVFRRYIDAYLKNHPSVNQGMIIMCRQLAPTDKGLPIEIYSFTNDTRWVIYEGVMADIFDHLLAAAPYFGLELFELPSSGDFRLLTPPRIDPS